MSEGNIASSSLLDYDEQSEILPEGMMCPNKSKVSQNRGGRPRRYDIRSKH